MCLTNDLQKEEERGQLDLDWTKTGRDATHEDAISLTDTSDRPLTRSSRISDIENDSVPLFLFGELRQESKNASVRNKKKKE